MQFYRPWELSAGEDDQIADQISDAQEQIDKELADFERQRELRLQAIEKSAIEGMILRILTCAPTLTPS